MALIRIVVVDDHALFLDGIKQVLSKEEGFEVLDTFNNAKDAILFIKNNDIDLLITDISMPEINGLEFVKIVNREFPKLKILAISMFKQIQYFKGVDGYILKESSYNELVKAIKTIVIDNKSYFYDDYESVSQTSLDFKKVILTKREKEIVALIAKQYSVEMIAEKLFLSRHTVESHKKNIFLKLQVNNAAGLIKKSMYLGYL